VHVLPEKIQEIRLDMEVATYKRSARGVRMSHRPGFVGRGKGAQQLGHKVNVRMLGRGEKVGGPPCFSVLNGIWEALKEEGVGSQAGSIRKRLADTGTVSFLRISIA